MMLQCFRVAEECYFMLVSRYTLCRERQICLYEDTDLYLEILTSVNILMDRSMRSVVGRNCFKYEDCEK